MDWVRDGSVARAEHQNHPRERGVLLRSWGPTAMGPLRIPHKGTRHGFERDSGLGTGLDTWLGRAHGSVPLQVSRLRACLMRRETRPVRSGAETAVGGSRCPGWYRGRSQQWQDVHGQPQPQGRPGHLPEPSSCLGPCSVPVGAERDGAPAVHGDARPQTQAGLQSPSPES